MLLEHEPSRYALFACEASSELKGSTANILRIFDPCIPPAATSLDPLPKTSGQWPAFASQRYIFEGGMLLNARCLCTFYSFLPIHLDAMAEKITAVIHLSQRFAGALCCIIFLCIYQELVAETLQIGRVLHAVLDAVEILTNCLSSAAQNFLFLADLLCRSSPILSFSWYVLPFAEQPSAYLCFSAVLLIREKSGHIQSFVFSHWTWVFV